MTSRAGPTQIERRPSPMLVSVLVPVRNDARRLARCLDSIRASRDLPAPLELIVADNGSSDDPSTVAAAAGARVVHVPGLRVAQVRNRAARVAQGEILVFIDADHEQDPLWIAHAIDTLRGAGVGAVGAPYFAPADGTWVQQTYDAFRRRPAGQEGVEWLGSGSLAVWRDVFEKVGGFDGSLEACEDVDFCKRVRRCGHRLVADARLVTVHHGDPATLRALFLGELWRARDNIRVSLRPPVTLASIPSVLAPVLVLALTALSLAGIALWITTGPTWLLVSVAGLLAIVGARAARMVGHRRLGLLALVQAVAVAATYEAARALALVVRVPHRVRQEAAASQGDS